MSNQEPASARVHSLLVDMAIPRQANPAPAETEMPESASQDQKLRLCYVESLLERSQAQLQETEAVLEQCYGKLKEALQQLKTLETDKQILQAELYSAQRELQEASAQLDKIRRNAIDNDLSSSRYELWVREAWQAYRQNNISEAMAALNQAYQCSPYERSQTVMDCVRLFDVYAQQSGTVFEVQHLLALKAWRQLMSNFIMRQ